MKKLFLITGIIMMINQLHNTAFSQTNLVPNPNFEDTTHCPTAFDDLSATTFWYSPNQGSTDYFNACDINPDNVGVPNNFGGYQMARSGNGYAGIGVAYDSINLNVREYLQVQLISALTAGKKYIVTAYLAKADSATLALKDIGIALSNSPISGSNSTTINFTPQIIYSQFLTDAVNWTEISDTIIANGGEQYLTIGYFKNNNTQDTLNLFYSVNFFLTAYHYVDDVTVQCMDCTNGVQSINQNNKLVLYPNPAHNFFSLKSENKNIQSIELISINGAVLKSFIQTNTDSYNISEIEQGIYFIKIIFQNKNSVYTKLIINH